MRKPCPKCSAPMDIGSAMCRSCWKQSTGSPAERLWKKVDMRGPDECWPWKGTPGTWGYGSFWMDGRNINASQAAYIVTYGPTGGLFVLHRCDNPPCCNPAHLFLGTQKDNIHDCLKKGRARGHFNPDGGKPHPRYSAKLTPELVIEARRLWDSGISQSEIGRRFKVNSSTIHAIVRRESWRHIP